MNENKWKEERKNKSIEVFMRKELKIKMYLKEKGYECGKKDRKEGKTGKGRIVNERRLRKRK
jgi:hypothetical protein